MVQLVPSPGHRDRTGLKPDEQVQSSCETVINDRVLEAGRDTIAICCHFQAWLAKLARSSEPKLSLEPRTARRLTHDRCGASDTADHFASDSTRMNYARHGGRWDREFDPQSPEKANSEAHGGLPGASAR
jgi:hypothetical protein